MQKKSNLCYIFCTNQKEADQDLPKPYNQKKKTKQTLKS